MIKHYLLCSLLLCAGICYAQSKQFQHITSVDGISQSEVYSFLEDSQGFMWFGTVDGLNKYDGYSVTTFYTDKGNPNAITNNTIRSLAEDALQRIWIGTDDGLSVYDSRLEKIHQVNFPTYANVRFSINSILVKSGKLYLATSIGFLVAEVHLQNLEDVIASTQRLSGEDGANSYEAVACTVSKNGRLWVATRNRLYSLGQNAATMVEELNLETTLRGIRNLTEDENGNLWIVSHDDGFLRYQPTQKRYQHFKKEQVVTNISSDKMSSVVTDKSGNLWIGTHDRGLLFLGKDQLSSDSPRFERIEHSAYNDRSLNSNLVYSLFVSKTNLLWIGSIGSGINIYDPNRKPFSYYNLRGAAGELSYSTNFIRAVYADAQGKVWVGAHNNGLFIYNQEGKPELTKAGFGSESVFHLNDAGGGNALACTERGVYLVRETKGKVSILSTLMIGPAFNVTTPEKGVFWVAALDGLKKCRLEGNNIRLEKGFDTTSNPALSFNNCRVLYHDTPAGHLFVGTEGGGLNRVSLDDEMNPVSNHVFTKQDTEGALGNNYVRSITKSRDGTLWVGTYEGLNKLVVKPSADQPTFEVFTTQNGLPNNTVQSLIEDDQNNLWIGTNQGLCRLDPTTNVFFRFTMNDGLQSNEFSEHTIFKKPDGEIIIGGINGINTFYPDQITTGDFQPNTTITDFYLFNERISPGDKARDGDNIPLVQNIALTDTLLLAPRQNSFGFDFSAMVYSASEKVRYAYRLKGFDEDWNITDANNRRANYTNLEYGKYTFEVKATNNEGVWEEVPASLFISIRTPIYLTTTAFILYGLFGLLLVIFFANYSILRHTTKAKILLDSQHNKKMRELEEMRNRFFVNISHDLRTPLTLISSPLDVVLNNKTIQPEAKSLLQLASRNVSKLKDMTEQLLDIRKMETDSLVPQTQNLNIVAFARQQSQYFEHAFKAKAIDLAVEADQESCVIGFDPDMLSKVLFNLLSNALKHTHSGKVTIAIRKDTTTHGDMVCIDVEDTGNGIDEDALPMVFDRFYQSPEQHQKGYGIGLAHSKGLVEAHGGHIRVQSEKGEGTIFSVYLPVVKAAVEEEVKPAVEQRTLATEESSLPTDYEAGKKTRILLVEDNFDLRTFVSKQLSTHYTVLEAANGEEGLAVAAEHSPDLIISDVMMPKMDGMEFCKAIKSNVKTSHIPVILLTAKAGKVAKYQGLEIGADDYIAKPFEMKYLSLKMVNLLRYRDRLRQQFRTDISLSPAKVTVTSIDEQFLARLMEEIEARIADFDFSISTLETTMGMSHSSFYNKIKSLTGQSAKELIHSIRMKRARQIMEDTPKIRVSEVAYMVGFSDPKYFSKRFREHFGCSPSSLVKKTPGV